MLSVQLVCPGRGFLEGCSVDRFGERVSFPFCILLSTSDAKLSGGGSAREESEIEEPEKVKHVDNVKDLDRAQYEIGFQDCVGGQPFD
jgi:hypothetical protein